MQNDYRIPAGGGRSRSVLVRATDRGVVQLGVLSVYGNVLEVIDLDAELQGAVEGALRLAREDSDRALLGRLGAAQLEAEERLRAARARNPYLNGAAARARRARRRRQGVVG